MKWVALFSQTGSEILDIIDSINKQPDIIYTNNLKKTYREEYTTVTNLCVANHEEIMAIIREMDYNDTIITLHGYLRLIPKDICEIFNIYNGHPGAITLYPELKGKDPQLKVCNNLSYYKCIGSVVHKVTADVDSGPIINTLYSANTAQNCDDVYAILRKTSLYSWITTLKVLLDEDRN